MHSWIFRNRTRLAIVYGLQPHEGALVKRIAPGNVIKISEDVLLGPWGKRTA